MRALSECCPSSDTHDAELTVHEVAAMTHTSEVSTGTELALMMQVRDALPLCWEALHTATLTSAHVKALPELARRLAFIGIDQISENGDRWIFVRVIAVSNLLGKRDAV